MSRKIGVERTFALRQYENIKLYDTFDETTLPNELAFNEELVGKLRKLQFIKLEMDFRNYINLHRELVPFNNEDAMSILTELRENTIDEINNILENNTQGEQNDN